MIMIKCCKKNYEYGFTEFFISMKNLDNSLLDNTHNIANPRYNIHHQFFNKFYSTNQGVTLKI